MRCSFACRQTVPEAARGDGRVRAVKVNSWVLSNAETLRFVRARWQLSHDIVRARILEW